MYAKFVGCKNGATVHMQEQYINHFGFKFNKEYYVDKIFKSDGVLYYKFKGDGKMYNAKLFDSSGELGRISTALDYFWYDFEMKIKGV